MMKRYSAAIVSHALWNDEFKKFLELRSEGHSLDEILALSDKQNIFQFNSATRARQVSRILKHRVECLPAAVLDLYPTLDESNKLAVNYLGLMLYNRLIAEFTYDVYRDEIIIGDMTLHVSEVMAFLLKKQGENEQIATWTDATIKRLRVKLVEFLKAAEMVTKLPNQDAWKVTPPYLDYQLEKVLQAEKLDYYLQAIGG